MKKKVIHIAVFTVIGMVYLITAMNSHGYYHADEHYQIIEFAGLKTGTHTPAELAWEFRLQLRPAIQPAICYLALSLAERLHISDPYAQASLLRVFTALLALTALSFFVKQVTRHYNIQAKTAFLTTSFLLWFIPFINVRFSSETWSGLFFVLSVAFLLKYLENRKPVCILFTGTMLGLSFLFRYQAAIQIVFLILWLAIIKREKLHRMTLLLLPAAVVFLCGIAVDTWFYGNFTLTSWNYFRVNILENATAGFGTSPWYQYITDILKFPGYPFGVIILVSLCTLLIRQPMNLFLWISLPFIVIHSMIGHKEARFLFPLVNFVPVIVFTAWQETAGWFKVAAEKRTRFFLYAVLIIAAMLNMTGIIAMMSKTAGTGRMAITKYIHDHYEQNDKMLVFTSYSNPYNPWHSLPVKYYQDKNTEEIRIRTLCDLDTMLLSQEKITLLCARYPDLRNAGCLGVAVNKGFVLKKRSIPSWIEKINRYYGALNPDEIIFLYESER
ncbi:MAG: hypothetical protein JXA03_11515 [Bacteroidales bacterium]|nr:hypothetical protein [Bacteroidales bacterium]